MAATIDTEITASGKHSADTVVSKQRKNPARRKAERSNTSASTEPPRELAVRAKMTRQPSAPTVLYKANIDRSPSLQGGRPSATASQSSNDPRSAIVVSQRAINGTVCRHTKEGPTISPAISSHPSVRRSHTSSSACALNTGALVTGGLIGCAAGAAIIMAVHVWYDFAGVKAAIATARAARICMQTLSDELIASLSVGTYSTDEALDILRRTTLAYASMVPDGGPVVERIFREITLVRHTRGAEVDKVLAGAYDELRAAGDKGLSAVDTRNVVLKHLGRLSVFASRATQDILARNPRLKPVRDGAVKALKESPKAKVPTTNINLVVRHKQ